jgi:hypothetical protein
VPKIPVIKVGRLNKITVKLTDLVPIHLVREIEETTHTAVYYCGINKAAAAISIELLGLFPEDMICQTCQRSAIPGVHPLADAVAFASQDFRLRFGFFDR